MKIMDKNFSNELFSILLFIKWRDGFRNSSLDHFSHPSKSDRK